MSVDRHDPGTFLLAAKRCDQCLFSAAKLVDDARRDEILNDCLENDVAFICHKATMRDGANVCCRGFHDRYRDQSLVIRLAHDLGVVAEVDP